MVGDEDEARRFSLSLDPSERRAHLSCSDHSVAKSLFQDDGFQETKVFSKASEFDHQTAVLVPKVEHLWPDQICLKSDSFPFEAHPSLLSEDASQVSPQIHAKHDAPCQELSEKDAALTEYGSPYFHTDGNPFMDCDDFNPNLDSDQSHNVSSKMLEIRDAISSGLKDSRMQSSETSIQEKEGAESEEALSGNKKRGSYRCRKCNQPKKGHVCRFEGKIAGKLNSKQTEPTAQMEPTKSEVLAKLPQKARGRQGENANLEGLHIAGTLEGTRAVKEEIFELGDRKFQDLPHEGKSAGVFKEPKPVKRGAARNYGHPRASSSGLHAQETGNNHSTLKSLQLSRCSIGTKTKEIPANEAKDLCLLGIMSNLPPRDLMTAAVCCNRWKILADRVWESIEEITLNSPEDGSFESYINFTIQKCPNLARLTLQASCGEDIDDDLLISIANSKPQLKSIQVLPDIGQQTSIEGLGLSHLALKCKFLEKIEVHGCGNLQSLEMKSSSLKSALFVNCNKLARIDIRCPKLKDFSVDLLNCVGSSSMPLHLLPKAYSDFSQEDVQKLEKIIFHTESLENLHICSQFFSSDDLEMLLRCRFPNLKRLCVPFASFLEKDAFKRITRKLPKLVHVDVSACLKLSDDSLLDFSRAYRSTLTNLFVPSCPSLTPAGVQIATEWLPYLEVLDLGYCFSESSEGKATPNFGDEAFSKADDHDEEMIREASTVAEMEETVLPLIGEKRSRDYAMESSPDLSSKKMKVGQRSAAEMQIMLGGISPCEDYDVCEDRILRLRSPHLKKLSLWGCSHLQGLDLDCPELQELNLNGCLNLKLRSSSFRLTCPELKQVLSEGCGDDVVAFLSTKFLA